MTRVFRVEHKERGEGPYNGPYVAGGCGYAVGTHPTPKEDGIPYIRPNEHCAFGSPAQMRRWFTVANRKALHSVGYQLAVYAVPDLFVRRGRKQVVFNKEAAKRIASRSLV